jgi:hypothetical protein
LQTNGVAFKIYHLFLVQLVPVRFKTSAHTVLK